MVFRRGRERRLERRRIRDGDEYNIDEENAGQIEREEVEPRPEPPIDIQGEPWGGSKWNRDLHPEGWREDGRYPGQQNREDPGPLDGAWPDEPDERDSDGPD